MWLLRLEHKKKENFHLTALLLDCVILNPILQGSPSYRDVLFDVDVLIDSTTKGSDYSQNQWPDL